MSDKKKGPSSSPGFTGAVKDLVNAVAKAAAPRSVAERKQKLAEQEAEANQRIYNGD
jgi:hypothetical protein